MASITSFNATRTNLLLTKFSIDYKAPKDSSGLSDGLERLHTQASKVDQFFQQQHELLSCIKNTPLFKTHEELHLSPPKYPAEDLKTSMINVHTIPLNDEQITRILNIANILRAQEGVKESLNIPQRFKIQGLCSITLLRDTTYIHLKKRNVKHIIGFGGNCFTHRCIKADADNNLSLVAELTRLYNPKMPKRDLSNLETPLPESFKRADFLLSSQTGYSYSGMMSRGGKKERFDKECNLYPHYDTDFFNTLTYDSECNYILPPETKWKMFCFALKSIKIIHEAGFVFRDIKAENFLISFGKTADGKSLDFENCTFALADFELAIPESHITDKTKWLGTDVTWPPRRENFKETQKKPADIYALGVLLDQISAPIEDSNPDLDKFRFGIVATQFSSNLIQEMTKNLPANRPTISAVIEKVKNFLLTNKPGYSWIKDYFPDVV